MTRTAEIADFITGTEAGDIPPGLRQKMLVHLVDTVAAGAAGSYLGSASRIRTAGRAAGTATLWGGHGFSDARHAALANAAASHMLELDDTGGCDHSGAVVVPAMIATCQSFRPQCTLDEALDSMAIGYEVARRVQFFLGGYSSLNQQGWHSTSVCGPFGSASATARLMGLSSSQVADALGIASSSAAGGWAFRSGGGENKSLHAGFASSRGLESAILAAHDVTGTRSAFEKTWGGMGDLYAQGPPDYLALSKELGTRWVTQDASIKPFPSCASSHLIVQLTEQVLVPRRCRRENLERLEIHVGPLVADICGEDDLSNLTTFKQRQLSIPYAVALTLINGELSLNALMQHPDDVPGIHQLLSMIDVVVDPHITDAVGGGRVTVTYEGHQCVFSTDLAPDPREKVSSLSQVLDKAADTLQSTGSEASIGPLEGIAEASGSTRIIDLFSDI